MVVNLLIAIGYFYFQPHLILTPRRFLLVDVGITFILVLVWNLILKIAIFSRFIQPVYLFSFNEELKYLEEEITKHSYLGFRVMGHISEKELANLPARSGVVIFPDNLHSNKSLTETIFNLRKKGIQLFNHNDFYESLLRRIYIPSLDEIWFLRNIAYRGKIFFTIVKNIFDLLIGFIIFLVFLITFPFIAVGIKLTSKGPIIFKQQRIGLDEQIFTIYKYRTMVSGDFSNQWTQKNDARITAMGKFLRISRLDELPQCINLLRGNMSVIGPRPEQVGIVNQLKADIPFYEERHIVKPGLTGWAQLNVYAGNLEESKLKLEYDLYYIKYQSILFDLEIIAKTVFNLLTLRGR
jgi:lipopolysaccharide/colanic/teichoic acid biosynthesis glycosyltransferase